MSRVCRRLVVLALLPALAAACGVPTSEEATRLDDESVPYGLLDPTVDSVVPRLTGVLVTLCLLDGELIAPVERRLEPPVSLLDAARALANVSDAEAESGLSTALGADEEIASVERRAGVALVDLAEEASRRLTADPLATVAQLVCTLTSQPGIGLVQFSLDGTPIEVPRDDGSLTLAPVSADDFVALYPPG